MSRDQAIGGVILTGSIVGIVIYGWLLYSYSLVVLQVTAFLAVAGVLGILAWIGWTIVTTPPAAPLEVQTEPSALQASSSDPATEHKK